MDGTKEVSHEEDALRPLRHRCRTRRHPAVALGVSASTLVVLAVALMCPLMMFVMMRTMMGGQAGHTGDDGNDDESVDQHRTR